MADILDYLGYVPVLGNIATGIKAMGQRDKGQSMLDKLVRPTYSTPNEVMQSLALAKNAFLNPNLPGQGLAENKLSGNTSQAIGLAQTYGQSPQDIMAAIVGANANQNAGYNDLAVKAAENQIRNRQLYGQELQNVADYRDKEFAYNKWMPYSQDRQYAESLIGAGNKNLYGSQRGFQNDLISLAALGLSSGSGGGVGDLFGNLFGGGKAAGLGTAESVGGLGSTQDILNSLGRKRAPLIF